MITSVSDNGKTFGGAVLTESNLKGDQTVMFNNKIYHTGNRYKDMVELMKDGNLLFRVVRMKYIRLVKLISL